MSNGKMVIKNGNQVIKMGPNGMEISNGSSNNIVMSSNGIQVYNSGSNSYSVDISSNNGISVNGRPVGSNYYTTSNNYSTQNYYENDEEDDEEEDSIEYNNEEDDGSGLYNMSNSYYAYNNNNNNNNNNFFFENNVNEEFENEEEIEEVKIGLDQDQIDALPIMKYSSEMEKQAKSLNKKSTGPTSNNFCSICIVDYRNGDKLRCLPCFHRFHKQCIDEWLIIKNECPLCKSSIE